MKPYAHLFKLGFKVRKYVSYVEKIVSVIAPTPGQRLHLTSVHQIRQAQPQLVIFLRLLNKSKQVVRVRLLDGSIDIGE